MKLPDFLSGHDRMQRRALWLLLLLIASLQALIFFLPHFNPDALPVSSWAEAEKLPLPEVYKKLPVKPFNPNFISDYKGYLLGLPVAAIDKLHAFRKTDRFVNSAEEFQKVTGIPDSTLNRIRPLFKFPDWVNRRNEASSPFTNKKSAPVVKQDINTADGAALEAVYGIGPALASRILEHRERLGGFVSMEQLGYVYGLRPEVIAKVSERFLVKDVSAIKRIRINEASVKELSAFPYFNYYVAKKIVLLRTKLGQLSKSEDLAEIEDLNKYNLKTIALYLEF